MSSPTRLLHLARRFFRSLPPGGPPDIDEQWARDRLTQGERAIWQAMSGPDRRHAVAMARAVGRDVAATVVRADLGPEWSTRFVDDADMVRRSEAAALLHDSGKNVSRLSTPARVGATIWWAVAPPTLVDQWLHRGGVRLRLAQYRRHPELGGRGLEAAGSHQLVHRWAVEHHRAADQWTVPAVLGRILKDRDDD